MKLGMRRLIALAVTLASAGAASACGSPAPRATEAAVPAGARQHRVPGEYLVTLAARNGVEAIAELYGRFGIKGIRDLGHDVFLVILTEDPGPARMEQLRGGNARIQAVQPNFVYGTGGPARLPGAR